MRFDVALAREEQRGHRDRQQAETHHEAARKGALERAVGENLEADQRIQRDV